MPLDHAVAAWNMTKQSVCKRYRASGEPPERLATVAKITLQPLKEMEDSVVQQESSGGRGSGLESRQVLASGPDRALDPAPLSNSKSSRQATSVLKPHILAQGKSGRPHPLAAFPEDAHVLNGPGRLDQFIVHESRSGSRENALSPPFEQILDSARCEGADKDANKPVRSLANERDSKPSV